MKNKIRIIAGIIICLIGAAVFLYPVLREAQIQKDIQSVIETIETAKKSSAKSDMENITSLSNSKSESSENSLPFIYPELFNEMADYNNHLTQGLQTDIGTLSYEDSPVAASMAELSLTAIGYIEIPSIDCSLPLFIGASSENLSKGAAVLGTSSMPIGGKDTNCVIAGHRGYMGSAFFRNINSIQAGDLIYISNLWGTLEYKAVSMEITDPANSEILEITTGKDMVTLVSCHPYMIGGGPERYIVHCERVDPQTTYPTTDISQPDTPKTAFSESAKTHENEASFNPAVPEQEEIFIVLESVLRTVLPVGLTIIVLLILISRKTKRSKNNTKEISNEKKKASKTIQ